MTTIELTGREAGILIEILESFLSDLKTERVRTENRELHAEFIEREIFVADLIKRLEQEIRWSPNNEYSGIRNT